MSSGFADAQRQWHMMMTIIEMSEECGITVSGMFCSNCGGDCPTGRHPYRDFKYCPYCGARMDGEGNEENEG